MHARRNEPESKLDEHVCWMNDSTLLPCPARIRLEGMFYHTIGRTLINHY